MRLSHLGGWNAQCACKTVGNCEVEEKVEILVCRAERLHTSARSIATRCDANSIAKVIAYLAVQVPI